MVLRPKAWESRSSPDLAKSSVSPVQFGSGFWLEPGTGAGWSSPVARQAHNLKVVGSNPTPATKKALENIDVFKGFSILHTGYALAMGIPWESREIQILAVVGVD